MLVTIATRMTMYIVPRGITHCPTGVVFNKNGLVSVEWHYLRRIKMIKRCGFLEEMCH